MTAPAGARLTLRSYWRLFRERPVRFWLVDAGRLLRDTRRAEQRAEALASLTPDERAALLFGEGWQERWRTRDAQMRAIGDALDRLNGAALSGYTLAEFAERLYDTARSGLTVADLMPKQRP